MKKSKKDIKDIEVKGHVVLQGETIDKISLKRKRSSFPRCKVGNSRDINEYVRQFYTDDLGIYESMFLLLLNNSNETIGFAKISQGGITGTLVDVRLVAKIALDALAISIVMVHNHPSGTLKPSTADNNITRKLAEGLKFLDIKFLDHLIITEDSYYSYSDERNINLIHFN